MSRTPVPVRTGRSFGDILRAVTAFLALAVLVLGIPASLAYFIGWPLPTSAPSLDMLRRDISFTLFMDVLAVAVWVAWAQFTACVLVEVKAAVSGVGMPARVPGAGPSQLLARNLVASLLLLSSSAAGFVPGLSSIGDAFSPPPGPGPVAAAQQLPGQERIGQIAGGGAGQAAQDAQAEAEQKAASGKSAEDTKFYRIQPPEGRHHDTLWGVAERHLGDGKRYKEIYQLNKDRSQPDGSKLTEASLIRPGWVMEMPADARGGELVEMPDESPEVSPEVREQIADYQRTGEQAAEPTPAEAGTGGGTGTGVGGGTGTGVGGGTEHAEQADHSTPLPEHAPESSSPQAGGGDATEAHAPQASAADSSDAIGLPEALLGAPLLAVGLLGALGRRRRQALWQSMARPTARGVGHGFEPPEGAPTDARDALLVAADPDAVQFLDRSLRGLSAALAAEGRQLPAVYAAWLGTGELHLQLTADAGRPPAPWSHDPNAAFWSIEAAAAAAAYGQTSLDGTAAPFPGLVCLGTRDGVRLLLNLEGMPGLVSLSGASEDRTALLASVAAELATSGWSDRLAVSLVGFGRELCELAPTRMRHLADVQALLEVMEAETETRRSRLSGAGYDSVLTGRVAPAGNEQWAPHLVLVGAEPRDAEAGRLAALTTGSDDLGIGYLVSAPGADLPGAVWHFDLTAEGRLSAPLMGLALEAQLLPATQRAAVVELFTAAEHGSTGSVTGAETAPGFTVDLSERGRPSVYARLMGAYEISGIDEPEEARSTLLREALAMLLLHREGVHPQVLTSGLWPRGVTDDVRDALIGRLRDWLGTARDGSGLLTTDTSGRLVLAASVVSDWDVLRTLHHETEARRASAGPPSPVRRQRLTEALDLARGPLLEDRAADRYGWLAHELVEAQYPVLVADVALALAAEYLAVDKPRRAAVAVRRGLDAAPSDERLWNELLRTTHATGDEEQLTEAAGWLVSANHRAHGGRGLPSPTEALLDELLPSWRARLSDVG